MSCWKLHISTQVIDSFPLTYCPKSCDKEKLSIPLEPHHNAQSSEIFLSFQEKIKRAVIFYLLGNPAETAYLSVQDGKLSNAVWLVQFWPRNVAVHTFLGGPKPGCSDSLRTGNIKSHNFFVLGPILVKFHIRTRLSKSFLIWKCSQEKLHFTPFHTLRQLKRDEALFPPLGRVVAFRARYRQILYAGFRG